MVDDPPIPRAPAGAETSPLDEATQTAMTSQLRGEAAESIDLPAPGYQVRDLIGKGGMGEVIAAHDQRIGRDVAIKRMRSTSPSKEAYARFWREARIQARLDHPAIVPVYELGTDAENRPFFTMKRLAGVTLAERLDDPNAPQKPLLRAFVEVCLAIDFAHSRGVIHRDLKPLNIMLGGYGEVYVLDWGVARVVTDTRREDETSPSAGDSLNIETQDGSLLGTAGYMAPEQMRDPSRVGPAADVYALGATLFEILAGVSLHPHGHAAMASTLERPTDSPASRRPDRDIAIELDAACMMALARDPDRRPSVRELANRIQEYLDGDRDTERRKVRAKEHLAVAKDAIASGIADRRAEAVREAGRALVLDISSVEAARLLTNLLVEPPAQLPEELEEKLRDVDTAAAKVRSRNGGLAFASLAVLSVFLPFLRIVNAPALVAIYAGVALFVALAYSTYRTGRVRTIPVFFGMIMMVVLMSQLAGPFVLVPALMCGMMATLAGMPWINERRWAIIVWVVVAALAPLAFEWFGVIDPTLTIVDGKLGMSSAIFETHGAIDLVALTTAHLVFLIVVGVYVHSITRERRAAQRKLQIQAWHLGKLIPDRR